MVQPATNPRIVQFGLFELDLDARELRKSGVKIKLQEQPFQILSMLLERPGTVVTREELQRKLWPGDTFVDFDLSLNSAVKKLRQALNDDSENPRFVETLYRRGYRFIGPVNGTAKSNADQIELEQSPRQRHPLSRRRFRFRLQRDASSSTGRSRCFSFWRWWWCIDSFLPSHRESWDLPRSHTMVSSSLGSSATANAFTFRNCKAITSW